MPTGDRAANLRRSIECFTETLRFFTPDKAPLEFARSQYSLGNAYAALPTGDRAANLAKAIECYTQALRFLTVEAAPSELAATQNDLGIGLLITQRSQVQILPRY